MSASHTWATRSFDLSVPAICKSWSIRSSTCLVCTFTLPTGVSWDTAETNDAVMDEGIADDRDDFHARNIRAFGCSKSFNAHFRLLLFSEWKIVARMVNVTSVNTQIQTYLDSAVRSPHADLRSPISP